MLLFLLLANALHFAINLFRRRHASARRIHVQNDGLDRRIVAKLLQLPDDWLWRQNHAIEIDHADAVAKAAEPGFAAARVQRQIDQGKHGQHEEEKCSSANQNPEQCARTSFRHEGSLALGCRCRERRP